MKIIVFADGPVGLKICNWLFSNFPEDIGHVVVTRDNEIKAAASDVNIPSNIYNSEADFLDLSRQNNVYFDWGFLLWWPRIISDSLINIPQNGFINTHPSFLPFNRGKHYNFWALVEEVPFGVSLHKVDEGIDCGDIVAQTQISYDWEDTGATLYQKASQNIIELFKETYPKIRAGEIEGIRQDLTQGSFHLEKELGPASFIDLDGQYKARDLLNRLRAKMFPGYPACTFKDQSGNEFEVLIEIRKLTK
jgi:methionyl-tRNA formyltransferase